MAFDRAMQLRCSLEERSSDLAKMDDAEIGFILDGSGGFGHQATLLLMLRIEARRSISPAMINEDNVYTLHIGFNGICSIEAFWQDSHKNLISFKRPTPLLFGGACRGKY